MDTQLSGTSGAFSDRKTALLVFLGVMAIGLAFAAFTQHAWEDYYTAYRVSRNLAQGNGLVYTIGQRVQAFTSPLGVMIPAGLAWLTGNRSDELVLWLYRFINCGVLGLAAVMLLSIARYNSMARLSAIMLVGMLVLDAKTIDYAINGMETPYTVFFIALVLHALTIRSSHTVLKLATAWTGLIYTRPDGFIYAALVSFGFLLFDAGRDIGMNRRDLLKLFVKAGLITFIAYLPWFLWSWHYFGSPIPNTISAKGYSVGLANRINWRLIGSFILFPLRIFYRITAATVMLTPSYFGMGGWNPIVPVFCTFVTNICALYWLVPVARPRVRAVSFALMCALFYLSYIAAMISPWYLPSCTILAAFVLAGVFEDGSRLVRWLRGKESPLSRPAMYAVRVAAVVVLGTSAVLLLCSAWQLRIQQRVVEDGNRKQIGLWLRQHASSPSDSVWLEPLGYIGYFSQLKMLDYPGLCAPEVVAAQKRLGTNRWPALIRDLRPDWLVLRPREVAAMSQRDPDLLTSMYSPVKTFDVSSQVSSYNRLPGRGYLFSDQTFTVYHRNPAAQ